MQISRQGFHPRATHKLKGSFYLCKCKHGN
uniref:Uncharacterized protein n=1 Tax=Anguilla anguilla TaxID=7936 RepID=A0A0E9VEY1_ANGAN